MKDFFDAEELKRVYYPEVEALVKKVSGASRVVVSTTRCVRATRPSASETGARTGLNVHNDYTECRARSACADLLPGEAEAFLKGASPSSRCGARGHLRSRVELGSPDREPLSRATPG